MKTIWTIAKRELAAYFDSLVAYVMLILFLGFSGFFTWLYGSDIFISGQASLQVFFAIAYWSLFFFIPAITMRLIAEERKAGTLELVLTKAVSHFQLLIGKFLSAWILIMLALLFTAPYTITLSYIGNPDLGAILCGYLGLMLMAGAYVAIGLMASSFSGNQIVAFLVSLVIGLCFHIIFGVLSQNVSGIAGEIFYYLNMANHYESISRGVIDTRDLFYFLSLIVLSFAVAGRELEKIKVNG